MYLAAAYGGLAWWPARALGLAEIVQWLAFAANEIQHSLCRARLIRRFGEPVNAEAALQGSNTTLAVLDQRLSDKAWLAIGRPSIVDCAVHPYVALGGIDLEPHRNLARWIDGVEGLPGYPAKP